jgi:hypothetical protein
LLRILDISGRLVQELALPADCRTVSWSATDNSGRPVPSGICFAIVEGLGFRSSAKFLVQR